MSNTAAVIVSIGALSVSVTVAVYQRISGNSTSWWNRLMDAVQLTDEEARRIDEEGVRKVVEALERAHPWIPKAAEREQKKIAKWRREQQRKAERDARRSA